MFRALLVDDHAGFRGSVSSVLRKAFPQIEVVEAVDGPEALRTIGASTIAMVLLDIRLPGPNGIELTKVIKTTYAPIVVVILTGYDLPQYRQAAFRNGADCFLYKGSTSCMNDVLARVEGAIIAQPDKG
jgi:DNA-binding NarL/FixJ family response regulator